MTEVTKCQLFVLQDTGNFTNYPGMTHCNMQTDYLVILYYIKEMTFDLS